MVMIIVSGCPRSGTSLMMNIMLKALGADRIMGAKFPDDERAARQQKAEDEIRKKSSEANGYERYVIEAMTEKRRERRELIESRRTKTKGEVQARKEETRDMNPNGFYECEYSVLGMSFGTADRTGGLRKLQDIISNKKKSVVKIVSQGLARTDPIFADKIIFMVRDPRSVAKSQERLLRPHWNGNGNPTNDGKEVPMRTVEMFIDVTYQAAQWLRSFPTVPVKFVIYDDLIQNPVDTISSIGGFVGGGEWTEAAKMVDPSLYRSAPEGSEGWQWDLSMRIYENLKVGKCDEITSDVESTLKSSPPNKIFCIRKGSFMPIAVCELCQSHKETRVNLIKAAQKNQSPWRDVPCGYECSILGKTVEQSIENNHWIADAPEDESKCKFAQIEKELYNESRKCMGRKVTCKNPEAPEGHISYESACNKKKCKLFTI